MKLSQTIFFIVHLIYTFSSAAQENIIIRPAILNDLHAIAELTRQTYYEHYKPFLKEMPAIINLNQELDLLLDSKIQQSNNAAQEFIIKQQNNAPYGVLIICNKDNNELIGCCRFNKKDNVTLYIYLLAINTKYQRIGLGSQLLSATINIFDDITTCKLRAFINNTQAHNFYEKYGFQRINTVALDLITGAVLSDPTIPPTHIDYQLIIRK